MEEPEYLLPSEKLRGETHEEFDMRSISDVAKIAAAGCGLHALSIESLCSKTTWGMAELYAQRLRSMPTGSAESVASFCRMALGGVCQ
jgi:hypothetical protein